MVGKSAPRRKTNGRLEDLQRRLEEAEQALEAIRTGQVESLVIEGAEGPRIFSLEGAAHSYRIFVEAMTEGAATVSEHGTILYCNAQFARMLEAPLQRVMGSAIAEWISDAYEWTFGARMRQAAGGESRAECALKTLTGREIPVYLSLSTILDGSRSVTCLLATDLREQKRSEEIVAAERLARSVFEQAADAIVVCDERGQIIRASATAEQLCGTNPLQRPFDTAFSVEFNESHRTGTGGVAKAVLGGEVLRAVPAILRCPDGTTAHILLSATALRAGDAIIGCVMTLVDVTEARRAEKALQESEENLAITLRSIGDAVIATDRVCRITRMNPTAERLTGWSAGEALGRDLVEVFRIVNEHTRKPVENPALRVLRDGAIVGLANGTVLIARDGTETPIADSGAPIQDAAGQLRGVVLVFRDSTQERAAHTALEQSEARLRKSEAALSEANQRKDEFLAVLSHELRNPLAPIRNSLHILGQVEPASEQARRAWCVIGRQVDHIARLVEDLLDVTRISRGKVELQCEWLDLTELLRRTVEDHRSVFTRGGIQLETRLPEDALWVWGDPTRLQQAVGNLLQNAAKFTAPGGHTIVALATAAGADQVVISVRDTGIGIAAELLPRLFEPFTQGQSGLDRPRGGLGLGLALVKGLIELHGGTADAHSEGTGRGAEFRISLPFDRSARQAGRHAHDLPGPGVRRRVLVIEDNVDAAESLREVLILGGHDVEVALDGGEGISKAREFRPDVVLCDIGLPSMDGYAVATSLRADPHLKSMFLVALTGYASADDVSKAITAGFDTHVAKPPSWERLQEVLAAVRGRTGRSV